MPRFPNALPDARVMRLVVGWWPLVSAAYQELHPTEVVELVLGPPYSAADEPDRASNTPLSETRRYPSRMRPYAGEGQGSGRLCFTPGERAITPGLLRRLRGNTTPRPADEGPQCLQTDVHRAPNLSDPLNLLTPVMPGRSRRPWVGGLSNSAPYHRVVAVIGVKHTFVPMPIVSPRLHGLQ